MSFLLDTCVVSELTRPGPDAGVAAWLSATPPESKFLSVITLSEIRFGILKAHPGQKQNRLQAWYDDEFRPSFADRILALDEVAALRWATIRADHRSFPVMDGQIAAIALSHDLTLVTRNVKDFAFQGLAVFNPWRK